MFEKDYGEDDDDFEEGEILGDVGKNPSISPGLGSQELIKEDEVNEQSEKNKQNEEEQGGNQDHGWGYQGLDDDGGDLGSQTEPGPSGSLPEQSPSGGSPSHNRGCENSNYSISPGEEISGNQGCENISTQSIDLNFIPTERRMKLAKIKKDGNKLDLKRLELA
ncbi:hypothetical protein L1887_11196 [Cichorium endivia]|nr:hypothetical protein L1887_11196 [Cichorium endivia]